MLCMPCEPSQYLPVLPEPEVLIDEEVIDSDAPEEGVDGGNEADSEPSELEARTKVCLNPLVLLMITRIAIERRIRGSRVPLECVERIRHEYTLYSQY